ncbi:hypothetical protein M1L59_12615 [Acinetobacter schindleri]|uniref:hypothetical protein n=2 Tax=Moraxellaceae TaxID=468 RepID=UPI0015D37E8D|nr:MULTISPECIES: hypothetical protein [Acinetobacter]MCK8641529.1 hypothetical protein [Acinetobacter schindleri]
MFLKKRWLAVSFFAFMSVVQAEEVKPYKYSEASDSYTYRAQLTHTIFHISSNPLIISSNLKKDILGEDTQYEFLKKIFKKNNSLIVVTWPGPIYGMQSAKVTYYIYEINSLGELINRDEVHFDSVSEIEVNETPKGIKIYSEQSKNHGKTFIYEFINGKVFDFSTSMNTSLIKKEEERLCKGFYDLYTTYEYEYDPYRKVENIYDLGTANYSWISYKVKSSPKLSDQLINTLKGRGLKERQQMNYMSFKNSFCD